MFRFKRKSPPASVPPAPAWLLEARQEWNDRNHTLARSRDQWAAYALFSVTLNLLLAGGLIALASSSRITPYVVEVNKLGDAVAFGPANVLRNPDERIWRNQLANCLINLRSVFASPDHQRWALAVAHSYLAGDALTYVQRSLSEFNPLQRAAKETVSVEITSILRLKPDARDPRADAWEITWVENRRSAFRGEQPQAETWKAYLRTTIQPPTRSDRLLQNPLGLFITYISWSRLTTPAPVSNAAPTASPQGAL